MKPFRVKYGPPITYTSPTVRAAEKLRDILAVIREMKIEIEKPCPLCGCNTKHRKLVLP